MMRRVTFISLCLACMSGWVGPRQALALDRYYCAVDDARLKLVVEAAFREDPGWPLAHMRGIVLFKPGRGQRLEGQVDIAAANVKQYWRDGETLRLYTSTPSGEGQDALTIGLKLESSVTADDLNRFQGTYAVSVRQSGQTAKPVEVTGPLTCSRF
ncbi:hypothetical protein [Allorhizobium undicola]|uniref:hypothetical protein n=1 Tax=Allorhizobium undicola TaxID=78527 RepID=UPI000486C7C2|nr:hypothetical protein [Allorhizobium undicola]